MSYIFKRRLGVLIICVLFILAFGLTYTQYGWGGIIALIIGIILALGLAVFVGWLFS